MHAGREEATTFLRPKTRRDACAGLLNATVSDPQSHHTQLSRVGVSERILDQYKQHIKEKEKLALCLQQKHIGEGISSYTHS